MKKSLLLFALSLGIAGTALGQFFPKGKGNVQLNEMQHRVLHQQMTTPAHAKPAESSLIRLIGSATYFLDELQDSTRYVYGGVRFSDLSNPNLEGYTDEYYPNTELSPAGWAFAQRNYLAYDTAYEYENYSEGLILSRRVVKSYDLSDRMIKKNVLGFNETMMTNDYSVHLAYEGPSDKVRQVVSIADTSFPLAGMFDTTEVYTMNYNSDGVRLYDSMSMPGWPVVIRMDYSYTASGLPDTVTHSSTFDGIVYQMDYRAVYTYNSNDYLVTALQQHHDGTGWQATNLDSFGYTGDAPLYTHHKSFSFEEGAWIADYQLDGTLLPGYALFDTVFIQENYGDGLENDLRVKFNYNDFHHRTSLEGYPWMGSSYSSVPLLFQYYYYAPIPVAAPAVTAAENRITLYPNPAQSDLFIASQGRVQIAVYNLSGQLLLQQNTIAQQGKAQVDVSSLPAGTYLADVQTEAGRSQIKFVKQ